MTDDVDLKELAVDRTSASVKSGSGGMKLVSRYLIPVGIIAGFVAVVGWSLKDYFVSTISVDVIKVSTESTGATVGGKALFRASGWIEPRPTPIRVAALAEGVVEQLLVVEDQEIKANQPVVTLVREDAQLELESAQAAVKVAAAETRSATAVLAAARTDFEQPVKLRAELATADSQLAAVETRLSNLPFEIITARANSTFATEDFQSKKDAGDVIPAIELKEAEAKATTAKTKLQELENQTPLLENEREALRQRVSALETKLELNNDAKRVLAEAEANQAATMAREIQANVKLAEGELKLKRMTVVAPSDGRVLKRMVSPGAHLSGGPGHQGVHDGGVAITMYDPAKLQVRADVRFQDVPRVFLNQEVLLESDVLSEPVKGRVMYLNPEADIQKNILEVKVEVLDPPGILKPQMLMNITFLSSNEAGSENTGSITRIFVPDELVIREQDGTFIWVADVSTNTAVRQRIITSSQTSGEEIEVTDGLNISSRIIVSPPSDLTDGARVSIK